MELLTAAQMRAFEQAEISGGAVTGRDLMERAGRGVVAEIFGAWPHLARTSHKALVLCGPGNNGGDGFVIARVLKDWGWEVDVLLYGDAKHLPPDALANHDRWCEMGAVLRWGTLPDKIGSNLPDVVIDALFGTGLGRPVSGDVAAPLAELQAIRARGPEPMLCVAVDMPSGLCSDSGRDLNGPLACDLTVTFHGMKPGHLLADGPQLCGTVAVVDIGLPKRPVDAPTPVEIATRLPRDGRRVKIAKSAGHKYDHGHAVILSGGMGRSGAARLAARGALRVGAGLVTVAAPGSAMMECATQLTAIMLRRVDEPENLSDLLQDTRLNALCLGPGLGVSEETRVMVDAALAAKRATVLDADALTSFADDPKALFDQLHDRVVLTPHGGEFARLFPDLAKTLSEPPETGPAYSKLDATRAAAERAGCVILFKGPDTVIADPTGCASLHAAAYDRAAPWLATAGSGDVLAGLITGLMARGQTPMAAAELAAWLHVEAARAFGPGLIAEDLPETLPQVFREIGS